MALIFYSPSHAGFYDDRVHSQMPNDAVQISKEEHSRLLDGESSGLLIVVVDGRPALEAPPVAIFAQLEQAERAWRDTALLEPCALRDRHRDQIELELTTTLEVDQFKGLLVYIQLLRDWPQSEQFPVIEHRPMAPPWLAEQSQ